jgi:hypothetical protein
MGRFNSLLGMKNSVAAAIPKSSPTIISRKNIDGTVSVLRLDNDRYFFAISGMAVEVWRAIDGKSTVQEIEEKVRKKHKGLPQRFRKDVQQFIKNLKREKLIHLI